MSERAEDMKTWFCDEAMIGRSFNTPPVICVKVGVGAPAETGLTPGEYGWVSKADWARGETADPCWWDWDAYDAEEPQP